MTINLNLGCSLEAMKTMNDNTYDLAVVDPPYGMIGLGAIKGGNDRKTKGRGELKGRAFHYGSYEHWDIAPNQEYFDQLLRVSKHQIIWGGQYFTDKLPASREWITWDKCQPWQNFSQVELAWTSFKGTTKLYKYDNRYSGKIHPTQKPVALYHWLFAKYTTPKMKILDTHLGSGSSAIAAHDCDLSFDGWEIDTEYHTAAVSRYNEHTRQMKLFT